MHTQDNIETCYQRGNRSTQRKTSPRPSKPKSIHWWIKLKYMNKEETLIYQMYLNPSSSCYQQVLRSHVFTSCPDPAISSKLHPPLNGFFQCFPYAPKLLSTLRIGEVSVWVKNLSRKWKWRGRSKGNFREIV